MSDLVIGKPVAEGMATYEKFLELMQGRGEQSNRTKRVLEDGVAFAGVAQFPARVKCALLGWSAWRDATAQALAKRGRKKEQAMSDQTDEKIELPEVDLEALRTSRPVRRQSPSRT